jgi:hypothetical protein
MNENELDMGVVFVDRLEVPWITGATIIDQLVDGQSVLLQLNNGIVLELKDFTYTYEHFIPTPKLHIDLDIEICELMVEMIRKMVKEYPDELEIKVGKMSVSFLWKYKARPSDGDFERFLQDHRFKIETKENV